MRTSYLACITLVVMLFATTTCPAYTWADAFADETTPYEYDPDSNQYSVGVWQPGWYNYSYSLTVDATAGIRGTDPTGSSASAYVTASVTVAGATGASIDADAYKSGELGGDEDDDDASYSDEVYMGEAGYVLNFSEQGWAMAQCGSPSSQAHARAVSTSSGSVW